MLRHNQDRQLKQERLSEYLAEDSQEYMLDKLIDDLRFIGRGKTKKYFYSYKLPNEHTVGILLDGLYSHFDIFYPKSQKNNNFSN